MASRRGAGHPDCAVERASTGLMALTAMWFYQKLNAAQ